MDRKEYKLAAQMIKASNHGLGHRALLANFMCAFFRHSNPDFDDMTFLIICGVLPRKGDDKETT
jgi:hypothetical protein